MNMIASLPVQQPAGLTAHAHKPNCGCKNRGMLERFSVFDHSGVAMHDVACRHTAGQGHGLELTATRMIVFVRRGCFIRHADGIETVLDSTVAYCTNPGEEQRIDHPHHGGDTCTALTVDAITAASLWGGDHQLPAGPLPISPTIDLEHRLLLTAAHRDRDAHELYEHAISLACTALTERDPRRGASGRPATQQARRQIVNDTRELLAKDPNQSLPRLAHELAVSPHHLSRTFRSLTGHTISQHRLLLRVRAASERLSGGERDLAPLSADLGFADQSHLTRAIHRQTGHTPSVLRQLLTRPLDPVQRS
jgi:AraC-like DNA-binding protein